MKITQWISPSVLGIDIQSDYLKLVQLKQTRQGFYLENALALPLPPAAVSDGKIGDFDLVAQLLAELTEALPMKQLPAVILLSSHVVRMQTLSLPRDLKADEIQAEITLHLKRDLPGLNQALSIDFVELASQDPTHTVVFFAAVRKDYLDQCLACFQSAEINVKIVEIDVFALHRAVKNAELTAPLNALIHVKQRNMMLLLFNQQQILFHQQWEIHPQKNLVTEINQTLQSCLATLGRTYLDKAGVMGLSVKRTPDAWMNEIVDLNDYLPWQHNSNIRDDLFTNHPQEFLLAAGAAMREVPRWC